MLPAGSIKISSCSIDGVAYSDYDADELFIRLPDSKQRIKVNVTLSPVS
jgi:predicted aconitase